MNDFFFLLIQTEEIKKSKCHIFLRFARFRFINTNKNEVGYKEKLFSSIRCWDYTIPFTIFELYLSSIESIYSNANSYYTNEK